MPKFRLWDTENKKIVWAIPTADPHKALQVWTNEDGSKLYVYDNSQYKEISSNEPEPPKWWEKSKKGLEKSISSDYTYSEYWPVWKQLEDETVGYYLTNKPTDLYNWDEWDKVSYRFMNGISVLQDGTVEEGETPEYAGETPTKAATAQYTYTFDDWDPEVGPIYKRTTYNATFTATVNKYDITFVDEDWTTELDSQELDYGATPVYAGETPTKEATAQYTYTFSGWTPTIATVTADATYTATYSSEVNEYDVTIGVNDETMGSVDISEVTADYGTAISAEANVLTIGSTTITATAESGYTFSSWGTLPATLTEDLTITANFEAETPSHKLTIAVNDVNKGSITNQRYDDIQVWDVVTYVDNGNNSYEIKCNNDNICLVSPESGYTLEQITSLPLTYSEPTTITCIFVEKWR